MKAYSIHPESKTLKEIDIDIQANTAYSFFNSILLEESEVIKQHVIYSDANAINENKTPFLIGGQLIVGDALMVGRVDFEDMQVSIPKNELESLITFDLSPFYLEVLEFIVSSDVNLYRMMEVKSKNEKVSLNIEWVLSTFEIADERTRNYFINELKNAITANVSVEEYMKKMATLALNAAS